MKYFARFLLAVLSVVPFGANCANIPTTRGNNLTAYNGASGTTNNNNWNALMNVRSGADSADMPVADFGNCNAIVLRCAQPKCANGGCVDVDVTSTIVAGCVRSNDACAKYGDDLVAYISAQLVAQSTAKSNANQAAAANAAAAQSAQQMAAMQQQMQQMQSQMAAQNAETVAQLQDALEEQKQLTAQAIADATAARTTQAAVNVAVATADTESNTTQTTAQAAAAGALTTAQQLAAQSGVSADILAREQISGQIMSEIENAQTQLNKLKETMTNVFDYAGCDSHGDNCTGPKRVKTFKQKAMDFFEPYDNVLGDVYDALILAQSVGVDITDIYMMLNDSCNVWGKYMCNQNQDLRYTTQNCKADASGAYSSISDNKFIIGGANCTVGKIIPQSDGGCQPLGLINNDEEVRYNWLNPDTGEETNIKVGCMSDMLDTSALFRNRKKGASIDIETLKRIIEQDAPSVFGSRFGGKGTTTAPDPDGIKYCKVNPDTFIELEKIVSLKTLPQNVCVTDTFLKSEAENKEGLGNNEAKTRREIEKENCLKVNGASWDEEFGCVMIASVAVNKGTTTQQPYKTAAQLKCEASLVAHWDNYRCVCNNSEYNWNGETCVMPTFNTAATMCRIYGAIPSSNNSNICDCTNATNKSGCLAYNSRTILNK